jgi:hypothetical protein
MLRIPKHYLGTRRMPTALFTLSTFLTLNLSSTVAYPRKRIYLAHMIYKMHMLYVRITEENTDNQSAGEKAPDIFKFKSGT